MSKTLEFSYSNAPQRSPEWFEIRRGKVTASRLSDFLAVSKAKATTGKPLKARLDYEKELMFERQFNANFNNFITDAMQDGIDFENFAAEQYEKITKETLREVGCYYNDYFVASPDREVIGSGEEPNGLVEIKVVRDNTFTEILMSGVPDKHMKQMQGQMWAAGANWCDYVALNLTTKKVVIIRVERDQEFIDYLIEALQEDLVTEPFTLDEVHDIVGELPDWSQEELKQLSGAKVDHSDSNTSTGGW